MQLVALVTDEQWGELATENPGVEWVRASEPFLFATYSNANAFFILKDGVTLNFKETEQPVFINTVIDTLGEMNAPAHVFGINGWISFLKRPLWEVSGTISETAIAVLKLINKTAITVKDEPGFISARAVAMIINEAYFALGDDVSSKTAIDTAMKLGTKYPFGPFEWAEKIVLKNVLNLLQKLNKIDNRYTPAPALVQEANQL